MPTFSSEEINLMCLYETGTCVGLIQELTDMMQYLGPDEMDLKRLAESVITKLNGMTEEDYAQMTAALALD